MALRIISLIVFRSGSKTGGLSGESRNGKSRSGCGRSKRKTCAGVWSSSGSCKRRISVMRIRPIWRWLEGGQRRVLSSQLLLFCINVYCLGFFDVQNAKRWSFFRLFSVRIFAHVVSVSVNSRLRSVINKLLYFEHSLTG